MRFWVTKNSELPVREQIVRQVILGILSEDLPAGQRLPSTRSVARRYKIHANTVSAAYHQLLEQNWLQLRRGSGVYVRSALPTEPLDALISRLLGDAQKLGHQPEAVLERLKTLLQPPKYTSVTVVDPEAEMRAILTEEIGIEPRDGTPIMAALQTTASGLRKSTKSAGTLFILRLRSVRQSLEESARPPENSILMIVSASDRFREGVRAVLIAAGIEPDCLSEVDTRLTGWQDRVKSGTLAVTDILSARLLPASYPFRVFRVIADSSVAELRQMCGCDTAK